MKFRVLVLLFFALTWSSAQEPPEEAEIRGERGGLSAESLELVMLNNLLSQKVGKENDRPSIDKVNWRDIWDTDQLLQIWNRTRLTKPWERYSFIEERFNVPEIFRSYLGYSRVVLVGVNSSGLKARGDSTTKEGLWWDAVVANEAGRFRAVQLPFEALPSDENGHCALRLRQPDLRREMLQAYEQKLLDLGAYASVPARLTDTSDDSIRRSGGQSEPSGKSKGSAGSATLSTDRGGNANVIRIFVVASVIALAALILAARKK